MQHTLGVVVAHFDGHGVATGAALASMTGSRVIARFPDTGPRMLAKTLRELDIAGKTLHIVDIAVDVMNPDDYINAVAEAARRAKHVYFYDHHSTDAQYLQRLVEAGVIVRFFEDALSMAFDMFLLADDAEPLRLGLLGVVADRDPAILRVIPRKEVEHNWMPLANTLDVLVRRDAQATADALVREGVGYLRRMKQEVDYPPYKLVDRLPIVNESSNAVLVGFVDGVTARSMTSWLPKTAEELLRRKQLDYAVIPAAHEDPRTKSVMYTVRVVQYWLSQGEPAENIVKRVLPGAKYVGHEKYVSVLATSKSDAEMKARQIYDAISNAHLATVSV